MQGITIPFWIFVLLVFFAVIALLYRVLAPSVRWFFRCRLNTAIDELNTRLDTRIQPLNTYSTTTV